MPNARPTVLLTRKLPDEIESRLGELFDLHKMNQNRVLPPDELCRRAQSADVIVPTLSDQLDQYFFDQLTSRTKLIANFGAGVDHINIAAADAKGITVTNTPSVLAEDAADMAMAAYFGSAAPPARGG